MPLVIFGVILPTLGMNYRGERGLPSTHDREPLHVYASADGADLQHLYDTVIAAYMG